MKKISLGLSLVSLLLSQTALARKPQVSGRGESCHKPHEFKPKDCRQTFVARSVADLQSYEQQRLQTGEEKKLILKGEFAASNLLIETDCEVRLEPKTILRVEKSLTLYAPELKIQEGVTLQASDLYVQTEKEFKLNPQSKITFKRAIFESSEKIELENKVALAGELLILNAPKCEIHKNATLTTTKKIGSCFNLPRAQVVLEATPLSGQVPFSVSFSAAKSFGFFEEFTFNFGNGDTFKTTLEEAVYLYESVGNFSATLSANGITSAPVLIEAKKPPYDNFGISYGITRVNPPQVIMSVDKIPNFEGGIKEYQWGFGDNSTLAVPFAFDNFGGINHDYAQDGVYTLSLRLKGQNDLVTAPVEQVIDTRNTSLPSPNYRISSFKGEAPFTVEVEALETVDPEGDALRYAWVFTDTGEEIPVGSQKKVQHTFTRAGVFRIFLYAVDSKEGQRSISIPIYVGSQNSLSSLPPYAIVETTNRFGVAPLTVDFSAARSFDPDGPTGQPISYQWTFFDSGINQTVTRFGVNLSYTFTKPGSYFPLLTVTDVTGQQSSFRSAIFVDGNTQSAENFTITALNQLRTFQFTTVSFTNGNDYVVDSFRWDLGDGTYRTGPSFTKTYTQAGFYTVKLQARKIDGPYEEFVRTLEVKDQLFIESAFIQPSQAKYNIGEPVSFRATLNNPLSDPQTTIFNWSFGDGTTLKGRGVDFQNVTHLFSGSANYQVSLTLEFAAGTSAQASYLIQRNQPPAMGDLKIYGLPAVAPVRLGFAPYETTTDNDGYITQYIYEWGDGSQPLISPNGYEEHTYENAGQYNVKVTAIDNFGAIASTTKIVSVSQNQAPIADFDILIYDSIAPGFVGIEAYKKSYDADGWIVQYEYDFGSGEKIYSESGYQDHTYSEAGTYTVKLRAQDNRGLWSELVQKNVTILQNQIPVAKLRFYLIDTLVPGKVHVDGYIDSKDNDGFLVQYEFTFGDGTKITSANAYQEHDYPAAGSYTLTLRVQDNKGAWSLPVSQDIVVNANQPPIAGLSIYKLDEVAPGKIGVEAWKLSSDSEGPITLYEYSFGDGTTETDDDGYAEHIYQTAGTYTVTVRVQDEQGEWSLPAIGSVTIKENQVPVAILDVNKIGLSVPITIEAFASQSYDPDGQIVKYIYDFAGEAIESTSNSASFITQNYGTVIVGLQVVDQKGARSVRVEKRIELIENLKPIAQLNTTPGAPYAMFQNISFSAFGSVDPDGVIVDYQWDFGDGNRASGIIAEHEYQQEGNYEVKLTLRDDFGNITERSQFIYVNTNQRPTIAMTYNPDPILQYTVITFDASQSSDSEGEIINFNWEFSDGEVISGRKIAKYFSDFGTQTLRLVITDNYGVKTEQIFDLEVIQNDQFLPVPKIEINDLNGVVLQALVVNARESTSVNGKITRYLWSFGDNSEDVEGVSASHEYEASGEYQVSLTVTDEAGKSATTFKTIKFEVVPYYEQEASDYKLLLSGVQENGFNPLNNTLQFRLEGGQFSIVEPVLSVNGVSVNSSSFDQNSSTFSVVLNDGKNEVRFQTNDAQGGEIDRLFVLYAGSRSVHLNLLNMQGDSRVRLFLAENDSYYAEEVVSASEITFQNVPALETLALVKNNVPQVGHELISSTESEYSVSLENLGAPTQEDFELTNGTTNWIASEGYLSIVEKDGRKFIRSSVGASGKLVLKNTITASATKPYVFLKREIFARSEKTKVLTILRNQKGELLFDYENSASIQAVAGVRSISPNDLEISVNADDVVESRIVIFEPQNQTVKNDYLKSFQAYAQAEATGLIVQVGSTSYKISEYKIFGVEPRKNKPVTSDSEWRYYNREICAFGLSDNPRMIGASVDKRFEVDTRSQIRAKIQSTEDIAIIGIKAIDKSNNQVLARFMPNQSVYEGNDIGREFLNPVGGSASHTFPNFILYGSVNSDVIQRNVTIQLLTMTKKDFAATKLKREDILDLANPIAELKILNLESNCELVPDVPKLKNVFPVLYPVFDLVDDYGNKSNAFMSRYTGGYFWVQGNAYNAIRQMTDFTFNDFSLQHGHTFFPHAEHELGLSADFKTFNYPSNSGTFRTLREDNSVTDARAFAKMDYEVMKYLARGLGEGIRSIRAIILNFYVGSSSISGIPDDESIANLSNKQIIRTDANANEDLKYFLNRTCIVKRTLASLTKDRAEVIVAPGHHDHMHMDLLDSPITTEYPLESKESLLDHSYEISENTVRFGFTLPRSSAKSYLVDLYYVEKSKERRIFQGGGTSANRFMCLDNVAKVNGRYLNDLSWCSDWIDFKPTFSDDTFNVVLPKQTYEKMAKLISKLKVRLVTLDNATNTRDAIEGFCREDSVPLFESSGCLDQDGNPVGAQIHPNGGGLVAEGAIVQPENYIGPNATICQDVEIRGKEVSISGEQTKLQGRVIIEDCVDIIGGSNDPGLLLIDALDGKISINGNCSDQNNRITTIAGGDIRLLGDISIEAPTNITLSGTFAGYNQTSGSTRDANHKIEIIGSCDQPVSIYSLRNSLTDLPVSGFTGPITLKNCIDISFGLLANSTIIGDTTYNYGKMRSYDSLISDSTIHGSLNLRYVYGFKNNQVTIPYGLPPGDYSESYIQGGKIEDSTMSASKTVRFYQSNVKGSNFNCDSCSLTLMEDIGPGSSFKGNSSATTIYPIRYDTSFELTAYNFFLSPYTLNLNLSDQNYVLVNFGGTTFYSYFFDPIEGRYQPTSVR